MKSNGVFGSGHLQHWNRLLNLSCILQYGLSIHISCSGLLHKHEFPLLISVAITSQYYLFFFLPWSRSSVIILLVWFQVLSINIIFFSLVPSLLLLEMHSFRFFSSSLDSIFACLRNGSLEQSSSSFPQPLFLVYFWRWKAISFTETELGPGNISAI